MAAAATAGESDARAAGRSHPEAEMVAAARGSDSTPVKLSVTDVYNRSSEVFSLETTITIGDLKRLLQEAFVGRPAPQQQRLIFRGKQCKEETQQLGHVMRGLDLSGQHNMHLIVSQPVERKPPAGGSTADVARTPTAQQSSLPQQRPQQQPPLQTPSLRSSSAALAAPPDTTAAAAAAAAAASSNERPERIQLSQTQLEQLQQQYKQALRENEKALEEHRQRFDFLSAQSRALTQQRQYRHQTPTATYSSPAPPSQKQQQQQQQQQYTEVSARAATRALGGNMPGPAGGGGVRDVTGPPPEGHIPAAGLGQEGEVGRGNLVDPAPNAPDIGREARGWFKMVFQCMGVILVFGIDADGWVLALLALGGLFAFLFRTGLLKEMLGSGRQGGGLWKKLCTGATVITEGGGILLDARYFFSAFFFSLFPKWQPVRSPEAIAVQAAAQVATQAAAQAQAEAQAAAQAQAEAQAAAQAQAEAQAAAQAQAEVQAEAQAQAEARAEAQAQAEAQAEALVAAVRVQAEQTLREAVAATAAAAAATTPAADHGAEEADGAVEDAVPTTEAVAVTSEATGVSPNFKPESEVDPAALD